MTHDLSVKKWCLFIGAGALISLSAITMAFYVWTKSAIVFGMGAAFGVCALFWLALLVYLLGVRLTLFTDELCWTLDDLAAGSAPWQRVSDSETLLERIHHRLLRLYEMMQQNRAQVDKERRELQSLVSDISHQVKTPVSNLKMVTDTLLTKPVTEAERTEFLQGLRRQTEKLDFLLQALVKTSRLESGAIVLKKKDELLFATLAQALSGIVYAAEKKDLTVTVDCPPDLRLAHDSKWTSEALFNLLDNAVKYTPEGGHIRVVVEVWEMVVKIAVMDTGKGIAESQQAAIFRRFYREEDVHDAPGVGIGLYLAREIITRQGGYIQVTSAPGQGATFAVFLPRR